MPKWLYLCSTRGAQDCSHVRSWGSSVLGLGKLGKKRKKMGKERSEVNRLLKDDVILSKSFRPFFCYFMESPSQVEKWSYLIFQNKTGLEWLWRRWWDRLLTDVTCLSVSSNISMYVQNLRRSMKKDLFPITHLLILPLHTEMLPGQLFSQNPTVRRPSFAWLPGINTESFIC